MRSKENRGERGAGKLVVIGCLGAIVLFGGIAILVVVLTASQVKLVEAHLAGMRSKDVEAAFKDVDATHITKEQVKTILELNPQVFGSDDVSFPSRRVETEGGQEKAEIVANITGTDGKEYTIQYVLLKSGEAWKIAGIRSDDIALAPKDLTIQGVKTSMSKLDGGATKLNVKFEVAGAGSRKNGEKYDYDVVLKGKLVDASGVVIVAEQVVAHFKDSVDSNVATVTGDYNFTVPSGVTGDVKATILVEDAVSGKGVSQVVPVTIEK